MRRYTIREFAKKRKEENIEHHSTNPKVKKTLHIYKHYDLTSIVPTAGWSACRSGFTRFYLLGSYNGPDFIDSYLSSERWFFKLRSAFFKNYDTDRCDYEDVTFWRRASIRQHLDDYNIYGKTTRPWISFPCRPDKIIVRSYNCVRRIHSHLFAKGRFKT